MVHAINRVSQLVLVVLSAIALVTVLIGFTQPPLPDEGALAHVFQLAVVMAVLTMLIVVATGEWAQPVRNVRRLAVPAAMLLCAFAALYMLENYYYPAHY